MTNSLKSSLEQSFADALPLDHLEVVDESGGHNVPAGAQSHFKAVLVSEAFAGKRLLARHRLVNNLASAEFAAGMHALAIHTYTPEEWVKRFGAAPMSPPCLGAAAGEGANTPSDQSADQR